jgi:dTDP-4-dehydrorhamnose 3,5-epimerase-like enzyme
LAWDDRTRAIEWPIESAKAALSEKDRKLLRFSDFISPFRYDEEL